MRKSEINALLRAYVKYHLSPKKEECDFVSAVYGSVQNILGENNCLQIGSYPRFTAVTPLHDLDVLNVLGSWDASASNPSVALNALQSRLESEYENPTAFDLEIAPQTHSITLKFSKGKEEVFSVDIVPAYTWGRNDFGEATYVVPETAVKSHGDRRRIAAEITNGTHQMEWIKSDPRGYITVATQTNGANDDFRKAVKLIKGWRASCKEEWGDDFPLKSFHLEQVVTHYFQRDPGMDIFDAVFKFFHELPRNIKRAHIPDRADPKKNVDAYVEHFTDDQQALIKQARDYFLIKLEDIIEGADVADLLEAGTRERASETEAYLFDSGFRSSLSKTSRSLGKPLQETADSWERCWMQSG